MPITIEDLADDINTQIEAGRMTHAYMLIQKTLSIWNETENFERLNEKAMIIAGNLLGVETVEQIGREMYARNTD